MTLACLSISERVLTWMFLDKSSAAQVLPEAAE
jgi:hypothetical protein